MRRILQTIKDTFIFLRLVDAHDGLLSLTNLAIFITLYKLVVTPAISLNDVGLVFVAIANYGYKKYINKEAALEVLSSVTKQEKEDSNG